MTTLCHSFGMLQPLDFPIVFAFPSAAASLVGQCNAEVWLLIIDPGDEVVW